MSSPKIKRRRIEKNIYVDIRCDAYRFTVSVHPLPRVTATFSLMSEGVDWARRTRLELLDQKAGNTKDFLQPVVSEKAGALNVTAQPPQTDPAGILIEDILANYEQNGLALLAGARAEASRLRQLRKWFGTLKLGDLASKTVETWKVRRLSGFLGSGRDPDRAAHEDGLSKHQKYRRKKAGKAVAENKSVRPVSTQTVRHELALLRRAIRLYFENNELTYEHGPWLNAQYIMRMDLPASAEARSRRLSDEEVGQILSQMHKKITRSAVAFALLTTLRRGEILSLRWEDVDFAGMTVRLRKPGHIKKTKVHQRRVPLLPGAIEVLKNFGPKERGLIFDISSSGLTQAWRMAADRAGLRDVRLHDCRREAISRLVEKLNFGLEKIVVYSGHSDYATLEKHYVRPDPQRVAAEASAIPAAQTFIPRGYLN